MYFKMSNEPGRLFYKCMPFYCLSECPNMDTNDTIKQLYTYFSALSIVLRFSYHLIHIDFFFVWVDEEYSYFV